jgi:hypothetical protein
MSETKIEKFVREEFFTNKKFARYAIVQIDINNIDIKKLVELFVEFEQINDTNRHKQFEEEVRERKKIEDEIENNKKRTSFSAALLKWLLLIDLGFNLFVKSKKNRGRKTGDIARDYYSTIAIEFLTKEFEKKSINSRKNQNDC